MRYRLELDQDDELIVRNVETDIKHGSVKRFWGVDPNDPSRRVSCCTIINREGEAVATLNCSKDRLAPGKATISAASREEDSGYASIKCGECRHEPRRIEFQLGRLLADAASEIARGVIEHGNGGLKPETKNKVGDLIAEICAILYASQFGSLNAERRTMEPYFADIVRSAPRLSFGEAAQVWGMFELRTRFPEESEAALKLALSWPLEVFEDTLKNLMPLPQDVVASKQTKH
jgi:hypothetical protein